jgi:hypothetical protein
MSDRILKARLPGDRQASAFPTGMRLSAYCMHGQLGREVRPNFDISVAAPGPSEGNKIDLLVVVQIVGKTH